MVRNRLWVSLIALTLALSAGACASKKGPEGAAAGTAGTDPGAPAPLGETGTGIGTTGAGSSAGLPIVYFDYDQAVVRSDAKDPLKRAAEGLKNGTNSVSIEGHCDERGSSEYNLALGERRAQAVKSYLRTLGVDGKRLTTVSYGKERPFDSGHSEAAWAKNRRAELTVER
ncbi:MAG: peptidoglycan-associated lipoprotein Pal [Pseudomonadota bacterium]